MATMLRNNVNYVYTVQPFYRRVYNFHSNYLCVFKVVCDLDLDLDLDLFRLRE
jgi:hypothetical protein